MQIAVVSGSHRPKSQSNRIAKVCEDYLKTLGSKSVLLEISSLQLPLWDEGVWSGEEKWTKTWSPVSTTLQKSDGIVVISPEWGGMVPAGLKNFFHLCGAKELGHKPGLIVSLSSARGGAYPVAELRMSSYKNTHLCYIPDQVIIRDCEKYFVGERPTNQDDQYLRDRLRYALNILTEYASALRKVRESGKIDFQKYPFGM